jgi:hypothetical protein
MGWSSFCTTLTILICLLLSFGYENIQTAYSVSRRQPIFGGFEKFLAIGSQVVDTFPYPWIFLNITATLLLFRKFHRLNPIGLVTTFLILFLIQFWEIQSQIALSHFIFPFFLIIAPICISLLKPSMASKQLFLISCIPSAMAGIVTSWTSSNGLINNALGLLPIIPLTLVFIYQILQGQDRFDYKSVIFSKTKEWHLILISTLLLTLLIRTQYGYVYRDDEVSKLTVRTPFGPYQGIYTSQTRVDFIKQFALDLDSVTKGKHSILYYDYFPAGYLFSNLKPASRTLFMRPMTEDPGLRPLYKEYYSDTKNIPDLVFEFSSVSFGENRIHHLKFPNTVTLNDPFSDFFEKHPYYQIAVQRPTYRVFTRVPTL